MWISLLWKMNKLINKHFMSNRSFFVSFLMVTLFSVIQKGKKCRRTVRPEEPVRITFAGCSTAQVYRPRTCGTCTDGRCCTPSLSRTVRLRFHCSDGEGFYKNVMWIQRCSCNTSCPLHSGPSSPSISLHNDIHTFRHWGWLPTLSLAWYIGQRLCSSPFSNPLPPCVPAVWAPATPSPPLPNQAIRSLAL